MNYVRKLDYKSLIVTAVIVAITIVVTVIICNGFRSAAEVKTDILVQRLTTENQFAKTKLADAERKLVVIQRGVAESIHRINTISDRIAGDIDIIEYSLQLVDEISKIIFRIEAVLSGRTE